MAGLLFLMQVVDYYNSKKLAYYYIKQVQHDACVMIGDAKEGNHPVVAVNDTREVKSGTVTVRDADKRGDFVFSFIRNSCQRENCYWIYS